MKALRIATAMSLAAAVMLAATPAGAQKVDAKNLRLLDKIQFTGGTELAASGNYLYAGELNGQTSRNENPDKGGLHIFDVSGGTPKEVGFYKCPGNDNDVEVVKPGLVAMGHHTNICNEPDSGEGTAGMILFDVRNARKPKIVGSINLPSGMQSHTIRPYPGGEYVYINPGGLPSNGRMITHIIDVSNPAKPKIAATWEPIRAGSSTGCHDMSFLTTKKQVLGFCAGLGGFGIWNVTDPLAPEHISTIRNPQIEFNHYATPSSDGKLLAIDDEAFAFHTCYEQFDSPTGRAWIYDISNPASPQLMSSIAPPRGGDSTGIGTYPGWVPSWCLSHGLDWQPGTHNLAVTWFTGGVSVYSLRDPQSPEELAYFQAPDSATYSALWHDGRLYTNDMNRGFDAFKAKIPRVTTDL